MSDEARARVCHVQLLPLMSGVQRAMLSMFDALDPERFELHVVCREAGPLTDELARRGVAVHLEPALVRAIRPGRDWTAYRRLQQLFRRERFDLVHTHSSKPGVVARVAARHAGAPAIVHHVHGFAFHEFSSGLTRGAYGAIERWATRYCDRVVFVNHEERQSAVAAGIVPEDKALTIYNGVDLSAFAPALHDAARRVFRRRFQLAHDETAILVAGRLVEQKQPLILPRIAAQLDRVARERPWRFVVAGEGPLLERLHEQVAAAGLSGRFLFAGWLPEPAHAFHGCDVVLQPSLWEGLSLTLLEGLGAGLPVVASRIQGNREIVTDATGFLCDAREPAAYAWSLGRLIRDASLRRSMGRLARQRAEQMFDCRATYRQVARLYGELLDLPGEPAAANLREGRRAA